jgi:hypothetical protein
VIDDNPVSGVAFPPRPTNKESTVAEFGYKTLNASEVAAIGEQVTAPEETKLDYASLLPAWEADHAAHAALLAAATTDEDKAPHLEAMATLEAAIIDGRKKVTK